MRGTVDMRRMGALDGAAELDAAFRGLDAHSSRMAEIVDDLIVIARAENLRPSTGGGPGSIIDLEGLIRARIRVFELDHPQRTITLETNGHRHEATGDPALLGAAVDQLIENALVHTGSEIHIRLTDDGGETVLEVGDGGPGIAPELQDLVFDRFVRGDPSRARSTGGSGLGLAIVRSVAASMGGRATLDRGPAGGSRFAIRLPRPPRPAAGSDRAGWAVASDRG